MRIGGTAVLVMLAVGLAVILLLAVLATSVSAQVPVAHVVSLAWDASASSVSSYNVYRGSSAGGPYTLLGSATGLTFDDTAVTGGQTYVYVVRAVDANGVESVDSNQAAATVPAGPPAILPLVVTTKTLPQGWQGRAYSAQLAATGGTPPYNWSSGTLPGGLMLSSGGLLAGTPTAAGSFPITFTVSDSSLAAGGGVATLSANAVLTLVVGGTGGTPPPLTCLTGDQTWGNWAPFPLQAAKFSVEFDATPSANGIDTVIGLSKGAAIQYSDLAVIPRFNSSGNIDARNGGAYQADNTIPYSGGVTYHFRLAVDVVNHHYDAFVTPAGGSEQVIGQGYAFRSQQAGVTALAYYNVHADVGGAKVCNFQIPGGPPPPTPVVAVSVSPATAAVQVGATKQFTATVTGASDTSVTWSINGVGTLSSSGLFTATAAGAATITATSVADTSKSASATVTVTASVPALLAGKCPATVVLSSSDGKTVTGQVCSAPVTFVCPMQTTIQVTGTDGKVYTKTVQLCP